MKWLLAILTSILIVTPAFACQIGWRSAEELEQAAEVVVLAEVTSAKHVSSSFKSETYEYNIKIEKTERGVISSTNTIVRYEDLKAHLRGQMRVCPLKNGSGIEHNLKTGQNYLFYLKSATEPEILLARLE